MIELIDVDSTNNGELILENGDFKVADVGNAFVNTVNFNLLTRMGEYRANKDFGSAPEKFVGKPNSDMTRNYIKLYIDNGIRNQGMLSDSMYNTYVAAVDLHEVAIILKMNITILDVNYNSVDNETTLAYKYDFNNGTLEKIS